MANSIAKLEKAFRRDPDSPLFARLADLYLEEGDIEYALELCEEGCADFPDYSTGFVVLSKCYEDQGDVEKAREAMGHALRLDPENPGGYKRLADLFQQLGVFPLALQSLQQAAYLDPFDNTLDEQIDRLTYQARKESTEERPTPEVAPLPAREANPDAAETAEALIAGQARKTDAGDEAAEPFAQVQALPEWSDSPDVSEALKEFEQGPNPLFAADGGSQTIEPTAQPESDEVAATAEAAPAAPAPPTAPSDGRDDAVAALGMEIFGGDISAATEGTDATAPPAPQAPAQTPEAENASTADNAPEAAADKAIEEDAATEAEAANDNPQEQATAAGAAGEEVPQVESWIRFSEQDKQPEDATSDDISIFSPDILPEDSEIFKPQVAPDLEATELDIEAAAEEDPAAPPEIPEREFDAITAPATNASAPKTGDAPASADNPEVPATPETAAETPASFTLSGQGQDATDAEDAISPPADLTATESANAVELDAAPSTDDQPTDAPTPFLFSDATTQKGTDDAEEAAAPEERTEPTAEPTAPAPFLFGTRSNAAEQNESAAEVEADQAPALPEGTEQANKPFFFTAAPTPEDATAESADNTEPSLPAAEAASEQDLAADEGTSIFSATETTENAATPAPDPTAEAPKSNAELLRLFHEIEQDAPAEQERAEAEPEAATGEPEPIAEVPAPTLAPVTDDPTPPDALKPNHPEEKRIATMTLAEIYTIQGLTQKAIETYRKLLAQDPNNTILRSKLESLKKSSGRQ